MHTLTSLCPTLNAGCPSADTQTLRIPKVFHYGPMPGRASGSFIIMEYLNFSGRSNSAELGRQLALMHLATPAVSWRL